MKKRVLSLFLAITLCLSLTPTGALAAEGQPPEKMVSVTQEAQIPAPALEEKEEEKTTPAENGADENTPPASPDEKPTENTPCLLYTSGNGRAGYRLCRQYRRQHRQPPTF